MTDSNKPEERDKTTFGVSAAGQDVLDALSRAKLFKTDIAAFQAAAMLALNLNIQVDDTSPSNGTKWSTSSVKPQALEFLEWYVPTKTPVRTLERFGNAGLSHIAERVLSGGYTMTEIFQLPKPEFD